MIKLQTPVQLGKSRVTISYSDKILILGSCFADNIGSMMKDFGFDVLVNPTGTLYNPESIISTLRMIASDRLFTADDCTQMGAGSDLFCSFSHHTSFARSTREEFLDNANLSLSSSRKFWKDCNKLIITLGSAWCWRHLETGTIVANCLKRDGKEFRREMLSLQAVTGALEGIRAIAGQREIIFTVSPIRHMSDGAHSNQLGKSALILGLQEAGIPGESCEYFPAYEIMMDELRDYRFYAEDMVHPSAQAVNYIWECFRDYAIPEDQLPLLQQAQKAFRASRHRTITGKQQ